MNREGLFEIHQCCVLHANESLFSVSVPQPLKRPKQYQVMYAAQTQQGRAIRGSSLLPSEGRLFNACHASRDIVPWMVKDAGLRILLE